MTEKQIVKVSPFSTPPSLDHHVAELTVLPCNLLFCRGPDKNVLL